MRILTCIEIRQCPVWSQKTDLFASNNNLFVDFFKLIVTMRNYDIFISADMKLLQLYAFYRKLFGIKNKKQIVLELMLDEERNDVIWKLKRQFQRICFSSIDCIFVSASKEITVYAERFNLPHTQFQFLPFHTCVVEPEILPHSDGYILAAGKTGRDYATLAKAVDGLDIKVVVISDRYHIEGITFPKNVEVHCDIPYAEYMNLLHHCGLVAVPLKKLVKSTGQVVFLEAMSLGKPVIVTETTGSVDYIEHGVTGMLVPPENPQALKTAIEDYLANKEKFSIMANAAFEQVLTKHTFEAYTGAILAKAESL